MEREGSSRSPRRQSDLVWETQLLAIPRRPKAPGICLDTKVAMLALNGGNELQFEIWFQKAG